ncbi:MAG: uroporphyrinogen-III C-methyltransferase [Deltaproteobacteria bacterium]|nr:uroporphyrinogen-III C-methyltransferase [Deltaproteobacteria bacterium]
MSEQRKTSATVYLVGAGPGDPDLITMRGYDLLTSCDALVYDSLAAPEMIRMCPAQMKFYAGKTGGGHAMTQEEINKLLVDLATRPNGPERIVRLKGGDPYVFGRGAEEALACMEAGVPFEVVPGVSAGMGAAAYAGVPVTHRGLSRGVTLVTGHSLSGGARDLPWKQLATSGLTLVFYMGVKHLAEIVELLVENGMPENTPAIVVQEGTTPGQRCVSGPVIEIGRLAVEAGIRPPAVTIVGSVVSMAERLKRQAPRPMSGKTVIFFRAEAYHYPEVWRLRVSGARVFEVPVTRCIPARESPAIMEFMERVVPDDYLLITSEVAVSIFLDLWKRANGTQPGPTLLLSSSSFGLKAESAGWKVIAPGTPGKLQLIRLLLAGRVPITGRLWVLRSSSAGPGLLRDLKEAGFDPVPVPMYHTSPVPIPRDVREIMAQGRADVLVFPSPPAARFVVESVPDVVKNRPDTMMVAAVGESTAHELLQHGLKSDLVPSVPTMENLVQELIARLGTSMRPDCG